MENKELWDYAIPSFPIWKKTDAFIEKERFFIKKCLNKGWPELLDSRVNAALNELENLEHEILLEIKEGTANSIVKRLKTLLLNLITFKLEIEDFAKSHGILLNSDSVKNDLFDYQIELNKKLGLDNQILNNKLSKRAIEIKKEIDTVKPPKTQFRQLFKNTKWHTELIKLLESREFIEFKNDVIKWTPPSQGNITPQKYLTGLYDDLIFKNWVNKVNDKEASNILTKEFNINLSNAVMGRNRKAPDFQEVAKDYHFIQEKER
ncbi:MAG: hypothetical protein ABJJ05_15090 [Maribacter litoralis]|uniref:hypothetical protein n=1 Tax=Maribacter litoralis TaxID=2059726 RepID=UPI003298D532